MRSEHGGTRDPGRRPEPPRVLGALLTALLPGEYGEEMREELDEGFRRRVEGEAGGNDARAGSRARAIRWYLGQIVRPDTLRLALLLRRRERRRAKVQVVDRGWDRERTGGGMMMGGGRGMRSRLAGARDDLRYALRSVLRSPGHATFACLTLALGIGATTAIFSGVESILLRPLPYENADRLYLLLRPYGPSAMLSPRADQVPAWREQRDVFESVEWAGVTGKTLTGRGPTEGVAAGLVRPPSLDLLGIEPALGRAFLPEEIRGEGARVAILSHSLWATRFGEDPDVLGEAVTLDGEPWTVVGVMPPRTPFPFAFRTQVDIWLPFTEARERVGGSVLAVVRDGVTADQVESRLERVRDQAVERGESADAWGGTALRVTEQIGYRIEEPLQILMVAVALLLLIACVNVANLLLSRSTVRRHETAVRAAIGAGRVRLARQLLLEALLLGGAGSVLGLAVAWGGLEAIRSLRPEDLVLLDEIRMNTRVLFFTMGVGVLAGILFGTFPAWQGSRTDGLASLRSGARLDREGIVGRRFRWLLVAGEVALSFALLVGSVMAVRALGAVQARDPGFEVEGLVAVRLTLPSWKYDEPDLRAEALERFGERMGRLGGVARVSMANGVPPDAGLWIGRGQAEGSEPLDDQGLFFGPQADWEYGRVLGIRLLAGRWFTEEEVRDGAPVTVLGRTAARALFGDEAPVGRRMRIGEGEWHTVVGVAPDVAMRGLKLEDGEIQHFRPLSGASRQATFALRLTSGTDPDAVLGSVRSLLRSEEPDVLLGTAAPVGRLMRDSVARERFTSVLLAAFAILALLLAAVGLYGVVSQVVGQRTREIGIRISLGARARDVRRLILGGGARAAGAGILMGVALTMGGLRILSSRFFGLEEGGGALASYAAAAGVLAMITLAACWSPARRASRVDPVEALRRE